MKFAICFVLSFSTFYPGIFVLDLLEVFWASCVLSRERLRTPVLDVTLPLPPSWFSGSCFFKLEKTFSVVDPLSYYYHGVCVFKKISRGIVFVTQ